MVVTDVNAESLEELKKKRHDAIRIITDKDAIIIPNNYTYYLDVRLPGKCSGDLKTGVQSRRLLQETLLECVMSDPAYSPQAYESILLPLVAGSNSIKNDLIKNYIPELEKKIAEAEKKQEGQSEKEKLEAALRRIRKKASEPVKMEMGR
jgi:hypothetical protein